jgi:hypothetical protein
MSIYVVKWDTESGDHGMLGYFREKPSEPWLKDYFRNNMPDEWDEKYQEFLVYWDVIELGELKLNDCNLGSR